MMKTVILTAAALVMTAGTSFAAPRYNHYNNNHNGISSYERAAIARSARNVSALKQRAWRDGRLSFVERFQINSAERRHASLVARAYRS